MPRRIQRTVGSSWRGRDGPGPPPSCAWEPASQPGAAGPAWASDEFSGALTRLGSRLLDIGRQSGGSFLFGPAGCKKERLKGVGELRADVPARRNRRRSSRYPRVASTRQTPTLRKQEAQRRKQPPRWSLACASIARQEKPPQFRPPPVLSSYPGPDKAHPLNRRIEAMSASRDARAES